MTLSATAIINGLTMLRAYNPEPEILIFHGRILVLSNGFAHPEALHGDDYRRMLHEGWTWSSESRGWELLQVSI